jgi:ABC-type maltose transport system permease subunit
MCLLQHSNTPILRSSSRSKLSFLSTSVNLVYQRTPRLKVLWGLYAAGALLVSVPVVLLFLILSRYLISGLSSGAVKG